MRNLALWRLSKISKKKLSFNKGRISKWFILIEVVSIMVDMMRRDVTLDHLRSTFRNATLMLSIQCLVLLNKMGLRRGEITHFLIWCSVCLIVPHYPSSCGGEALKTTTYILNQVPSKSVPKTLYDLWSQNKPSLYHFHAWGYKVEVRPYTLQSKKLDSKTISGYFIGYYVGSRCSKFYCLLHTTRAIESNRDIYFEDDTGTSQGPREIVLKEHPVFIPVPIAFAPIFSLVVDQHPVATIDDESIMDADPVALDVDPLGLDVVMNIPLRRLERAYRPAISDDYIVYLQEHEYDVGDVSDPTTYKEAIIGP